VDEASAVLVPSKALLPLILTLLVANACTPLAPLNDGTEAAATSAPAADPTTTPGVDRLLPHLLYFLSRRSGSQQVWRLETDGVTQRQITTESSDVLAFDVSAADGSVAFVADNQLYMTLGDGADRRLLVDNAAADPQAAGFYYNQRLSDPLFSPDGRFLAYAYNGVWILELSSFQAVQFLENERSGTEGSDRFYSPLLWAPDGQRLLLTVGSSQGSTLAFLYPGAEPLFVEVEDESGQVCCHAAWAPDSSAVVVASPYFGLIEPGAWRYEAQTGVSTRLLDAREEGLFHFAGWPLYLPDGSLTYFYASSADAPEGDVPLYMVTGGLEGDQRTQLRPDAFSKLVEVLWAEDGSLALVVQVRPDGGPAGSVLLAASDGRQLELLLDEARMLRWGP
jgi:Tol biopolymer transport system component